MSRVKDYNLGYKVRLRMNFRASEAFLLALGNTLDKKSIKYLYKEKEHRSRPRPILTVSGKVNIWKLCQLVPENLPDSKNMWSDFKEILDIIDRGEHLTLEGFEKILIIKGEI